MGLDGREVAVVPGCAAPHDTIQGMSFGSGHRGPEVPTTSVPAMPVQVPGTLLDIREIDEWQAGRALGAVHIPMSEVPARLGEIDLDEPVHVICRSGVRSARVVVWLNQNGAEAVNVAGGTLAWQQAGRPMVADGDGEPFVR